MNRREFVGILGLSCVGLFVPGCTSVEVGVGQPSRKGPPSHAPAHGYRKKNRQGLEMTFDSSLGVYVVLNYPMYYYLDGKYYRKNKNKWETSSDINKKWKKTKKQSLPKGLQSK